jgi:hypothetical protein
MVGGKQKSEVRNQKAGNGNRKTGNGKAEQLVNEKSGFFNF